MQSRLEETTLQFGRNAVLEPDSTGKATRIRLLDFHSAPMRTFHLSWFAFFLSFLAWFGIAPLMAVVRDDLKLTKAQVIAATSPKNANDRLIFLETIDYF